MDNLGQAGREIPLPSDIQNRIENARNNVTILEAEALRLQKLAKQETDSVQLLVSEKNKLTGEIAKLQKEKDESIGRVAAYRAEIVMLQGEVSIAKSTLENTIADTGRINAELTKRSAALDAREVVIQASEEDLNKRNIALIASETMHNAKVEKLKKALE